MSEEIIKDLDLIDVGQLAKLLKVSTRHVYNLAEEGKLPCVKLGARVLFRPSTILAAFEKQEKSNYGRAA